MKAPKKRRPQSFAAEVGRALRRAGRGGSQDRAYAWYAYLRVEERQGRRRKALNKIRPKRPRLRWRRGTRRSPSKGTGAEPLTTSSPRRTALACWSGGALHDSHLHLTNYIQEGQTLKGILPLMGDKVGRVAVFGLPLQQMWDKNNSGDFAPTYYLQTDAPLYYYSFTDAWLAMQYKGLTPAEQARFDPMIIGFNPADMYAADHIKRVLMTFPGVFSGIGEFTIHKEFVSAKIAGEDREPARPGARPDLRLLRGDRPGGHPPQRRGHAVPEARARNRTWSCRCATC